MADAGSDDFYFQLREELIVAIYSDDMLAQKLFLKGGNALNIVHGIGRRTSLDLDCSMEGDIEDVDEIRTRLFRAIADRLKKKGLVIFDETFQPRPGTPSELADPRWGGYSAQFKIADLAKFESAGDNRALARRTAHTVEPGGQSGRVFSVQLSRFEYCGNTEEKILGGFTIHVYTPEAIAAEKLRSLCQQMPGGGRKRGTARARDCYDIHALVTEARVDLASAEGRDLLRRMFDVKGVPLRLLADLGEYREFHRAEWPRVQDAVGGGDLESFDFYFDYVLKQVRRLDAFWVEDAP